MTDSCLRASEKGNAAIVGRLSPFNRHTAATFPALPLKDAAEKNLKEDPNPPVSFRRRWLGTRRQNCCINQAPEGCRDGVAIVITLVLRGRLKKTSFLKKSLARPGSIENGTRNDCKKLSMSAERAKRWNPNIF
ncbi:hypothetical protein ACJJTC_006574 [Scirpophaga incertulas]